jgi:hypothetical protein
MWSHRKKMGNLYRYFMGELISIDAHAQLMTWESILYHFNQFTLGWEMEQVGQILAYTIFGNDISFFDQFF